MKRNLQGEALGWHYATNKPVRVRWKDGRVSEIAEAGTAVPADTWLVPGLFDLQVNGYGGIDFQQDDVSDNELLNAVRCLRADGCTRFLLTLITDEWGKMMARLRRLVSLRASSPALRHAIAGWHIEGPFLSSEPGFCGTHNRALMIDPKPGHISELRQLTGEDPVLLTISPERPGALEAIAHAVGKGITVSLGHTNASAAVLEEARRAGATLFTHLANGCTADLNRHDNILWRVLDSPTDYISLIPDQVHISPRLFRILHKVLPGDTLVYITDTMSAGGAPPGRYRLGPRELQVGADGIVREPGTPYLSGSALRPLEGVFRAARMLGCPWQTAWRRFSDLPARAMKLPSGLEVGQHADFYLLEVSPETGEGRLLDQPNF